MFALAESDSTQDSTVHRTGDSAVMSQSDHYKEIINTKMAVKIFFRNLFSGGNKKDEGRGERESWRESSPLQV